MCVDQELGDYGRFRNDLTVVFDAGDQTALFDETLTPRTTGASTRDQTYRVHLQVPGITRSVKINDFLRVGQSEFF